MLRTTLLSYMHLPLFTVPFMFGADFSTLKKQAHAITNPHCATFPVTKNNAAPNLFVRYDSLQELSHDRAQALGIQITRGDWGKSYTICKAIFDCNFTVRTIETEKPKLCISYIIIPRLSLIKLEEYSSWKKAANKLDPLIRSSRRKQYI